MSNDFPRHLLEKVFGREPRLLAAFEEQAEAVAANTDATAAAVETTGAIKDAAVVVLSENSEFTNERVLLSNDDIELEIIGNTVRLKLKDVPRTENYEVRLIPTGDTLLTLPLVGTLISSEQVLTMGNFVNDAAAAGGGVPVGGLYRNGSVLMVRVV